MRAEILARLQTALAGGAPVEFTETGQVLDRADVLEDYPAAAVIVRTSGSTGTPKETVLSAAALKASATATQNYLGFAGQWLLCLPVHYVAGLSVMTRSLFAGFTPVWLEPGPFTAEKFTAATAQLTAARTLVSVVPTQLQRILADPAATEAAASFDAILVGGAATNSVLYQRATAAGLKLHRTYGMAETCGGLVYDGIPLPGVSIRVDQGRIAVAGAMLAQGYFNQPALNDERFMTHSGKRFYLTDDLGTYDGVLQIQGRLDDVIITGGVKVSAAHIQNQLAQVTAAEVCVVGVQDPIWGTRVCAAVEDQQARAEDLLAQTQLSGPATPKSWWMTNALPRLSTGKVDRGAVQRYFHKKGN